MFRDRFDAARQLVSCLQRFNKHPDTVVLAVPRGGLQLGYVLARELQVPLDVLLTKKIGYPGNPECAIGAVSLTEVYIDKDFKDVPQLQRYIAEQIPAIRHILQERSLRYHGKEPTVDLRDKIVIIVDDGVATGSTLMAGVILVKKSHPRTIIVALPVASPEALAMLRGEADEVICLQEPRVFFGVGQFYQNFEQVDDEEAIRLFHEANE